MKIVIYSICWNEEVILPYYFKHYKSRFPSAEFVVYDNMSDDKSREIIFNNGGKIIDVSSSGEFRDDINMSIKNTCWKLSNADWVIVSDMDEFIDCDESFLNSTSATIIKGEGYEMVGETSNIECITIGARNPYMDKSLVFNPFKIKEINYSVGAHSCSPVGEVIYASERVPLKHMKYLNLPYVIKHYDQLQLRLSEVNNQKNWGQHYRQSIEEIKETHMWLLSIAQDVPLPFYKYIYLKFLHRNKKAYKIYKFFKSYRPQV